MVKKATPHSGQRVCFAKTQHALAFLLLTLAGSPVRSQTFLPILGGDGKEIGKAFRTDGKAPSNADAASDKRACLLDPKEISTSEVQRVQKVVTADRKAGEIEVNKLIMPCMKKRGWRIELN